MGAREPQQGQVEALEREEGEEIPKLKATPHLREHLPLAQSLARAEQTFAFAWAE